MGTTHPLPVGSRILSVRGEAVDDGILTETGPNAVGQVLRVDGPYHLQEERGFVYMVGFDKENDVVVFLDQFGELDDPTRYRVLSDSTPAESALGEYADAIAAHRAVGAPGVLAVLRKYAADPEFLSLATTYRRLWLRANHVGGE